MKKIIFILLLCIPCMGVAVSQTIETDGMAFYVLSKAGDPTAANFDIKAHSQNGGDRPAKRWAAVALVDTAYITLRKDGVNYDTIVLAPGTSISSTEIGNPQCDFVRLRRVTTSGFVSFVAFYDR